MNNLLEYIFTDLKGYVEIREKGSRIKSKFLKGNEIKGYKPPKDKNIYFGCFERKTKRNGKKENCNTTNIIWLDFDKIGNETIQELEKRASNKIESIGMPLYSAKVFSGNGYHFYWKLKSPVYENEELLKSLANLTGADNRATDKARIMRVPGSNNCKDPSNIKKCELIELNKNFYDISIFEKIAGTKANQEKIKAIEPLYKTDKPCINNIMPGVNQGSRSFWFLRLIADLYDKNYSCEGAKDICYKWNLRNTPQLDSAEFNRTFFKCWKNYKNGIYFVSCNPTQAEHKEKLDKYCIFESCKVKSKSNIKSKIEEGVKVLKMDNKSINKLTEWTGKELLLLFFFRDIHQEYGAEEKLTIKQIQEQSKISKPTLLKLLNNSSQLSKHIEIIKRGKTNYYKLKHSNNFKMGYTRITRMGLYRALDLEITPRAFKIYVLLCKMAGKELTTYISFDAIQEKTGIKTNVLTMLIRELEEKNYILKRLSRNERGLFKAEYDIL